MSLTESEPLDRRVQRTRAALRDALLSLLMESGWDDVNVQDICERANVGRSTFYMHFQNKEQLLDGGLSDLRGMLRRQGSAKQEGVPDILPFARGLIEHIYEQRKLFRSIIGRRSGHVVQTRFREMVLQLVEEDLSRFLAAGWQRDATVHYVAGAFVALLSWWVDARGARPIDEIERHVHRLTLSIVTELGGANEG